MRVTKTIRAYVEQEVGKRVQAKHQAELDLEKQQSDYVNTMKGECEKAARDAYFAKAEELKKDFVVVEAKEGYHPQYFRLNSAIARVSDGSSAWSRVNDEIRDTVQNIVVELELGGDKAKLMELLEKI